MERSMRSDGEVYNKSIINLAVEAVVTVGSASDDEGLASLAREKDLQGKEKKRIFAISKNKKDDGRDT